MSSERRTFACPITFAKSYIWSLLTSNIQPGETVAFVSILLLEWIPCAFSASGHASAPWIEYEDILLIISTGNKCNVYYNLSFIGFYSLIFGYEDILLIISTGKKCNMRYKLSFIGCCILIFGYEL